ncbi:MAG: hypothetical protein M1826_002699 [Phylliscum demangeonii]|nr:MAG: hypothetical protein M1826_002699 [Phylliscum demangeonii]
MDLVSSIRKEGSRGGRSNFKWEDVKDDQHRENYLGHSLKAPVGRWQKNRDLSWYAQGEKSGPEAESAIRDERAEEMRRIKEAERDALSAALGFPVQTGLVPAVMSDGGTAGGAGAVEKEIKRAIAEATAAADWEPDGARKKEKEEGGRGLGFGGFGGGAGGAAAAAAQSMLLDDAEQETGSSTRDGRGRRTGKVTVVIAIILETTTTTTTTIATTMSKNDGTTAGIKIETEIKTVTETIIDTETESESQSQRENECENENENETKTEDATGAPNAG